MHAIAAAAPRLAYTQTDSRRRSLRRPSHAVRHFFGSAIDALENASAARIGTLALIWVLLVGFVDYSTGPEYSMLIFYLIPVTLGTWFVSRDFGMLIALLSVLTSSMADIAAGLPHIRYWNESIGLTCYVVFVALLSRWRGLLKELDMRVRERTAELQEEITERSRLEKEMNTVGERERRRLGHDLHDSLCQHLTGTALCAQTLREKLAARGPNEVHDAARVVNLLGQAIDLTRTMARGLLSPDVQSGGLVPALNALALSATERFGVDCELQHDAEIGAAVDSDVCTQLYRIAQEAVANAGKHAHASRIIIELDWEPGQLALNVYDNGIGCEPSAASAGLGLRMMQHGARLIGADFSVKPNEPRGTVVSCLLESPAIAR